MGINLFCDPSILTEEERRKLSVLNSAIPSMCQTFGPGLASHLAIRIQTSLGKSSLDSLTGFFNLFYYPAWTTLYHLARNQGYGEEQIDSLLRGQAMAMFLHMLDDHLVDGEIPVDHMLLAIRSRAWQIYEDITIQGGVPRDRFQNSMHRYVLAVSSPPETERQTRNLGEYLQRFREQAITWFVLIEQLCQKEPQGEKILQMYEEFVFFWRLLDDWRDWEEDLEQGERTAFTIILEQEKDVIRAGARLRDMIRIHLKRASDLALEVGLPAVARQLSALGDQTREIQ